jgi:alkylation response protein AidB-like acyl-CoA dehydrogenase
VEENRERVEWELTAEEASFRDEVSAWLANELRQPYLAGLAERSATEFFGVEPEFSRRLGEAGYLGITTPAEHGGAGRSHVEQALLQNEIARHRAPILGHFVAEREVLPALLRFGTEAHRARLVPGLLAGATLGAQGFTEPGTGSDLAAVATSAERVDGGFVVNGTKWLNSVAQVASYLWVIARTDPGARHRGLSMFLISVDTPGIRIEPLPEMTGIHRLNRIVFDGVEIDEECLVGELNGGWTIAMDTVARERAGSARPAWMRRMLTELAAHVPADNREAVPVLAELDAKIAACEALWHRYAWETDRGRAVPELAGTTLKVYADDVEAELADAGAELLGRDGVLDIDDAAPLGGRLARLHLAAPGFSLGGGTSEILKTVMATRGLGLAREGRER